MSAIADEGNVVEFGPEGSHIEDGRSGPSVLLGCVLGAVGRTSVLESDRSHKNQRIEHERKSIGSQAARVNNDAEGVRNPVRAKRRTR